MRYHIVFRIDMPALLGRLTIKAGALRGVMGTTFCRPAGEIDAGQRPGAGRAVTLPATLPEAITPLPT